MITNSTTTDDDTTSANTNNIDFESVAYSSQGSHTGQLNFCNRLADSSTTG